MMRLFSLSSLTFLLLLQVVFAGFALPTQAAPVKWYENVAEAAAVRQREKRPAIIYFYNHQARPARQMLVETLENPDVQTRLEQFVCLAINQRTNPELAKQFNLFKVPTVIFLDNNGKEVDRAVGFKSPEAFTAYIERITKAYQNATTGQMDTSKAVVPFKVSAVDFTKSAPGAQMTTLMIHAPNAKTVHLIGDFNDWRFDATPMAKGPNGVWGITTYLQNGAYEYLFYIDGKDYQVDVRNPLHKVNPLGTSTNSVLLIGPNQKFSPLVQGRSVFFNVYDADAKAVQVAGTFNNWERFTMYKNPKNPGEWGVRYDDLPPGTYQYKFIIDDQWKADPENYAPVKAQEGGHLNSSFTIR